MRKESTLKKALNILGVLLFILTLLLPVGVLLSYLFGYTFELKSYPVFALIIAVISVVTAVLAFIAKDTSVNKVTGIFMAVLVLFSLVNAAFFTYKCQDTAVLVSVGVWVLCSFLITGKLGKPTALKWIMGVLSSLLVIPVTAFIILAVLFGNFGLTTVVYTTESENGEYYVEKVIHDQGALGADTIVNLYENKGIDTFVFKISKAPKELFRGDYADDLIWKDAETLIIGDVEYKVK